MNGGLGWVRPSGPFLIPLSDRERYALGLVGGHLPANRARFPRNRVAINTGGAEEFASYPQVGE